MAWFISAVSLGALVDLKCPHCGRTQMRARKVKRDLYVCKFCRQSFSRDGKRSPQARR